MTPKQRVLSALAHEEPDRVPTGENQMDGTLVAEILGRSHLCNMGWEEKEALWSGRRDDIVRDYGDVHVQIPRALEWDYVRVPVVPPQGEHKRPEMTGPYSWVDDRGFEVHFNPEIGNLAVAGAFPDLEIDDLPDPDEPFAVPPGELDAIRHVVAELGDTHFVIGRTPLDGTFPWQSTVGMEEFLVRMITDPEFVDRAVDVYASRSLAYIEAMLDAGVDAIMTTDDYSDNAGPIMGRERFRRFVLPGLIRQCEAVHSHGGYFIKHTDGNVWDILDDFVDIGIDGWHGIQPAIGMDLARLKKRYRGRLCFFGGVDCDTLIAGTAADVRREVAYAIENAAPGGGLVVTTSNVVQIGVKLANYRALRSAVDELGRYPIVSSPGRIG
jgi:uroporphyrinogen decarboxylase